MLGSNTEKAGAHACTHQGVMQAVRIKAGGGENLNQLTGSDVCDVKHFDPCPLGLAFRRFYSALVCVGLQPRGNPDGANPHRVICQGAR